MKLSCSLLFAIVLAISSVSAWRGRGGIRRGGHTPHSHNLTCRGEPIQNREALWAAKRQCFSEILATTTNSTQAPDSDTDTITPRRGGWRQRRRNIRHVKKNMCYKVCVLEQQKILNEDGSYNSTETEKFIQSIVPGSTQLQSELKTAFDNYATEHGATFSTDNNCEGYKEFKICKKNAFHTVCGLGQRRWGGHHGHRNRNQTQTTNNENESEENQVGVDVEESDMDIEAGP